MKLAFLHTSFATWGGIERVWIEKMNFFVSQYGYDIYLITSDQGDHSMPYQLDSRVHHIDMDIKMHSQYRYRGFSRIKEKTRLTKLYYEKLKEILISVKPDILNCTTTQDMYNLLKIKGKIPVIVESHLNFLYNGTIGNKIYTLYNNYWVGKADVIVSLTEGDARNWQHVSRNVRVIPNFVHLNDTGRYSNCTNNRAIFVGRLVEQKGLDFLIRIWKIVNARFPDWQLDVYGEGRMDSIPDINLYVHTPTSKLFDRYIESSFLLSTSIVEPFGLVIPESMSCGIPVVAFDCPYGPASIITEGKDGFLIPLRNVEIFVDRVVKLINDRELCYKMGQEGILSSKRYCKDAIMQKWNELYNFLL